MFPKVLAMKNSSPSFYNLHMRTPFISVFSMIIFMHRYFLIFIYCLDLIPQFIIHTSTCLLDNLTHKINKILIGLFILFYVFKKVFSGPQFSCQLLPCFSASLYRIILCDGKLYLLSPLPLFPFSPEPTQGRLLSPIILSKLLLSEL